MHIISRKTGFRIIYLFIVFIFLFAIGEIGVRLIGFQPEYHGTRTAATVEPGGKFFKPDPYLGYTNYPGHYEVTLKEKFVFTVTNDSATHRITHPIEEDSIYQDKDKIWVFGCSCTYGWSINDSDTYCWGLQQKNPGYEVINYGVNGYGTVHSLLQLEKDLEIKTKPKVVILAYGAFHDIRNTFRAMQRKSALTYNLLGENIYPYAKLDEKGEVVIYKPVFDSYKGWPLNRYSALINFLEKVYNYLDAKFSNSHEVTKAIILKMNDICKQDGIIFVVAGIVHDENTLEMLDFCNAHQIPTTDISVININNNYTNEPYDGHPNAKANKEYARKLNAFLKEKKILN